MKKLHNYHLEKGIILLSIKIQSQNNNYFSREVNKRFGLIPQIPIVKNPLYVWPIWNLEEGTSQQETSGYDELQYVKQ